MTIFEPSANPNKPGAARVLARCITLSELSSIPSGIFRSYLSPEHKHCNVTVAGWFQYAGMDTWTDAVGNIWGHYAGQTDNAPVVILGSHLDTVRNAGSYDGILGVLAAIEVVEVLSRSDVRLPFAIDVVGFADQEGARFGTPLLGSRGVTGSWEKFWLNLSDSDGVTLRNALIEFGLDPESLGKANRSKEKILAYLEMHIEQGPVLEHQNQPVAVVNSIAGNRRFNIRLIGQAGHAGTVPMELRRDPIAAAALAIHHIEKIANRTRIVATVGQFECSPGAVNVIAGECEFSLDIHSSLDTSRDTGANEIITKLKSICSQRKIKIEISEIHNASAKKCSSDLQRLIENVILEENLQPISITSGTGHDAMVFADITKIGMLFVRCAGGISHQPNERVTHEDVNVALNVFYKILRKLPDIF